MNKWLVVGFLVTGLLGFGMYFHEVMNPEPMAVVPEMMITASFDSWQIGAERPFWDRCHRQLIDWLTATGVLSAPERIHGGIL